MKNHGLRRRAASTSLLFLTGILVGCTSSQSRGPVGTGGSTGTGGMALGEGGVAGGQAATGAAAGAGSAGGSSATVDITSEPRSGGSCPPLAAWTPPSCGVCGNGLLDSCIVPLPCHDAPPGSCGTTMATEACDGALLGTTTCTTLGFTGGTLACDLGCYVDTRLCQTCGTDVRVESCQEAFDCAEARSLALATHDDKLVLAWVNAISPDGGVDIATLNDTLVQVRHRRLTAITDGVRVALAATTSGFVLAVEHGRHQVELIPLTEDGAVRGAATHIEDAYDPMLAARGTGIAVTGGPLLGFINGDGARMVVLVTDEGVLETKPVEVGAAGTVSTATFTGDGFLYALDGNYAGLTRIGLDGRVKATAKLGAGLGENPQLTWAGDHAVMTFVDRSPGRGLLFQRLDASGNALGDPVNLGTATTQGNRSPVLTLPDGDLAVLLGGFSGEVDHAPALSVVLLDPTGVARDQPVTLATDPLRVAAWRVARRSSEMIVAWLGSTGRTNDHTSGGLHVARIAR